VWFMSTVPSGYQAPKTNWQAADIVHPSDFNRIEGNIQAIETGQRTLDPSQAPSGNQGTLRQMLDWFANRLKAITGAANWYDAPATTLAATKSHMDATSGIHGATSSATANRLIIRDSNGRAKVAPPQADDDIATKKYVDDRVGTAVVVLTGTISHGGTLPIPSGFTEQQCKFFVSINTLTTANTATRDSTFGARLNGRQVWCRWENTSGGTGVSGTANYMVIGVK